MKLFPQQRDQVLMIFFPFLFEGTSIHDYNQAQFIERKNNCITIREWQEREGTLKQDVEIITAGAEQMPVTTYADSDYVSPFKLQTGCVDDLFEKTDNNSDEMIGDIMNDMYRKDYSENDTPMKKKQLLEYEPPLNQAMNSLYSRMTGDLLNDMYTKDDSGNDCTPMKKSNCLSMKHH